jgi:hypothetical protein
MLLKYKNKMVKNSTWLHKELKTQIIIKTKQIQKILLILEDP